MVKKKKKKSVTHCQHSQLGLSEVALCFPFQLTSCEQVSFCGLNGATFFFFFLHLYAFQWCFGCVFFFTYTLYNLHSILSFHFAIWLYRVPKCKQAVMYLME